MIGRHLVRRPLALVLLACPLLGGALSPASASAGFNVCRTDPLIMLSNGTSINVEAAVADSASDVQSVTFTLHLPANVTVSSVSYIGTTFNNESVLVGTPSSSGTISIDTVVQTGATAAPAGVGALTSTGNVAGATGVSGTPISITLTI